MIDIPQSATFSLIDGVDLYGSFSGEPGTEGDLNQQDRKAYPTILSGDIDGNDLVNAWGVTTTPDDIRGENACHVVTAEYLENNALDGLIITAGHSNRELPDQYKCKEGGGMKVEYGGKFGVGLSLSRITFIGNKALLGGGIHSNQTNGFLLNNVRFIANEAHRGGGMYTFVRDKMISFSMPPL